MKGLLVKHLPSGLNPSSSRVIPRSASPVRLYTSVDEADVGAGGVKFFIWGNNGMPGPALQPSTFTSHLQIYA